MHPGDPNGGGASRKSLIASCEASLRRLRTDYIDLYWMHVWDKFTPIEETMRALDDLVRAGKVRYIGFSDTPAWKVAQAQLVATFSGWTPLVALQIEYSLIERTVEGELIPMARELGLGVTPWGALRGGALSGKYTRENASTAQADRGARVTAYFNEKRRRSRSSTSCSASRASSGRPPPQSRWRGWRRSPASPPRSSARAGCNSSTTTWPHWT
jgi:aryl-alcohol dehydrogenase-like predicted oxidoreductase